MRQVVFFFSSHLSKLTVIWTSCHPLKIRMKSGIGISESSLQSSVLNIPPFGEYTTLWLIYHPKSAAAAKSLQSCPTLCDLIDDSPPGSSIHGIFQARVLEWVASAKWSESHSVVSDYTVHGILQARILEWGALPFSRGSSQLKDRTQVSSMQADSLPTELSWVPKNWCVWTVVLEKTLEGPLDCKEIQLVHPKGNQSWIFIGRTEAEAGTPIFWPSDGKNWLIWKDPVAGKDWRQEEKGTTEDEMVWWHHWLNGCEFE